MDEMIVTEGLTKEFGAKRVVDNVNLTVKLSLIHISEPTRR